MHIGMRISLSSLFVSFHSISELAEATTVVFLGDSILARSVVDFCEQSNSRVVKSIGDIAVEGWAELMWDGKPGQFPEMCNITDTSTLLLDFFAYGFGNEVKGKGIPPSSKESLTLIHKNIKHLGINVDGFILEANLWDVLRWSLKPFLNASAPKDTDWEATAKDWAANASAWEAYTKDWAANATEMFQLVEKLFPESKHMWLSTCIQPIDPNKIQAESLNKVARTVLPDSWTYLDVESILKNNLHYRDFRHLDVPSTIPLVSHILDLVSAAEPAQKQAAIRGPGGGPSWAWGVAVAAPAAFGAAAALGGAAVAFRRWGAALAPARAHMFRLLDGS
jgi:hypothetical protein